jgi:tRNA (mo5U34)-methyltransferase
VQADGHADECVMPLARKTYFPLYQRPLSGGWTQGATRRPGHSGRHFPRHRPEPFSIPTRHFGKANASRRETTNFDGIFSRRDYDWLATLAPTVGIRIARCHRQTFMDRHTLRQQVDALRPWFHNIDLAGVLTAPDHFLGDYPQVHWQTFEHALPDDLHGRTVLDVGCNAGFFAIKLKQRGAARVVGIDSDARYLAQARLAADVLGIDLELRQTTVYDVASLGERFDIVLFLGVLYHLRHPLLALDLLREHVVGDALLFQTMLRGSMDALAVEPDYPFAETAVFDRPDFPKMHFIERKYAGDPSNWWIPNRAGAEAMLRSAGFAIVSHPAPEVFLCRIAPLAVAIDDAALQVELSPVRSIGQPRRSAQ